MTDIQQNLFFEPFNQEMRRCFLDYARYESHGPNEILFKEDDPTDSIYLLIAGEVELIRRLPNGRVHIVATVTEGDYFGDLGILEGGRRGVSSRTVGETKVAKIPAEPLIEIVKNESAMVSKVCLRHVVSQLVDCKQSPLNAAADQERLHLMEKMAEYVDHDLKAPITNILLAAELIAGRNTDETMGRWCRIIRQQAAEISLMTQELLDYGLGYPKLALKQTTVKDLLEEFAFMHGDSFREAGIEFSIRPVEATLFLDPARFARVLRNLVDNAVEAIGVQKDGRIALEASIPEGRDKSVDLDVIDNGPGIPEIVLNSMFEPFVVAPKRKSVGLGLAMAQKIVQVHGGVIRCSSEAGKGTTFTIQMPRSA